MVQNLSDFESFRWVFFEKRLDKMDALLSCRIFADVVSFQNLLENGIVRVVLPLFALKGHLSIDHSKEDHSCSPQVYCSCVPFSSPRLAYNFGSHVSRCPDLFFELVIILRSRLLALAEVCNFDDPLVVD